MNITVNVDGVSVDSVIGDRWDGGSDRNRRQGRRRPVNNDDERDYAEEAHNRRTMLQEQIAETLAEAVPAVADLDILAAAFADHAWGTTEPRTSPDEQIRWTCKCGTVIKVGLTGSMVDMTRLHLFTELLRALADAGRLVPAVTR